MCSRNSGFSIGYGIGRNYQPAVVSLSVMVLAKTIGQLEFRYRTETKIVVSVVHYCQLRKDIENGAAVTS